MSNDEFHVHGAHEHELEHASHGGGHDAHGMTNQIAMFTAIIATVGAIFGYMGGATQANAGLYKAVAPTHTITATYANNVSTGNEGYALYVKNNASGITITSGWSGSTATNTISSTLQTIATAAGPISSNNTADIALDAAIASSTPAGAYSDSITLVGTGKY